LIGRKQTLKAHTKGVRKMRKLIVLITVVALSMGIGWSTPVMADRNDRDSKNFNRCDRPSFNRGIEEISFRESRRGNVIAQVKVYLGIGDTTDDRLDLSFDLNLYVNGALMAVIPQEIIKDSAIKCAVTCAGSCPSIFGDGVCSACGCDYNNWLTHVFGEDDIDKNDIVRAEIVPALRAEMEEFEDDDVIEAKFHRLER
jgi:hypothetical protein